MHPEMPPDTLGEQPARGAGAQAERIATEDLRRVLEEIEERLLEARRDLSKDALEHLCLSMADRARAALDGSHVPPVPERSTDRDTVVGIIAAGAYPATFRLPKINLWRAQYEEAATRIGNGLDRLAEAGYAVVHADERALLKRLAGGRRVRHKGRGGTYRTIALGRLRSSRPLVEGDQLYSYIADVDGSVWHRPRDEFEDGRFEAIVPAREDQDDV